MPFSCLNHQSALSFSATPWVIIYAFSNFWKKWSRGPENNLLLKSGFSLRADLPGGPFWRGTVEKITHSHVIKVWFIMLMYKEGKWRLFPKVWVLNFLTLIRFFLDAIWAWWFLGLPQSKLEKNPSGSCILAHAWLTKAGTLTCTSWRAGMFLHSSLVAIQMSSQIFPIRRELITLRTFKSHAGLWKEKVTVETGFPSPFPPVHLSSCWVCPILVH